MSHYLMCSVVWHWITALDIKEVLQLIWHKFEVHFISQTTEGSINRLFSWKQVSTDCCIPYAWRQLNPWSSELHKNLTFGIDNPNINHLMPKLLCMNGFKIG